MNELSLFSGIGGGLLGTKLLGWKCIGAVEIEKYPCKILEQRIKDKCFEPFPIWNIDIREFNKRYAKLYRGVADVITAGFPCQPFSVAGKRQGADDERNMWPATIECIRLVRPRYVLLENVPGLLTSGYLGTILRDLAESGYDIRWRCLSAAEVGSNHKRNRLWIVAYTEYAEATRQREYGGERLSESKSIRLSKSSEDVANTANPRTQGMRKRKDQTVENMVDTSQSGLPEWNERRIITEKGESSQREKFSGDNAASRGWWSVEPDVGRLAYGISNRLDRLKAIGNAQVPAVVKAVWELLTDDRPQ